MNTKTIGARAEGAVMSALLKQGKKVLLPFGENARYDIVVDEGGKFVRIQCKSGRCSGGAVLFNACSATSGVRKAYKGQIEFFGVYCAELDKVYLVPVEKANSTETALRLTPATTRNPVVRARSLNAEDFEIRDRSSISRASALQAEG